MLIKFSDFRGLGDNVYNPKAIKRYFGNAAYGVRVQVLSIHSGCKFEAASVFHCVPGQESFIIFNSRVGSVLPGC